MIVLLVALAVLYVALVVVQIAICRSAAHGDDQFAAWNASRCPDFVEDQ